MQNYGYICISDKNQNLDKHLRTLTDFGITSDNIYFDQIIVSATSKTIPRPSFRRLLRLLEPEDVVVIENINMLNTNWNAIINDWKQIIDIKEAHIKVLDLPLLDTTYKSDPMPITGLMISNIFIAVFEYLDAKRQESYDQKRYPRKNKGDRLTPGPKIIEPPDNFQEVSQRWINKELSINDAADLCNVSVSTFRKWIASIDVPVRRNIKRPDNYDEIKKRYEDQELTLEEAGELCGVSRMTFSRWIAADKQHK